MKTRGHEDAKWPFDCKIMQCDITNSEPRNPSRCAIAMGAMREYGFEEFIVYRTISYGLLPNASKYLRWQNANNVREILEQFDINEVRAKKRMPSAGVLVNFYTPRKDMRTDYLKSDKKKEQRRKSNKDQKGKPKRSYRIADPLTLQGVRWGTKQKT